MSDEQKYRVRDRNWSAIWGENLSLEAAERLKREVVAKGKSTTARVELMTAAPPAPTDGADGATRFELLVGEQEVKIPANGVIVVVLDGHELLVNGVVAQLPHAVATGDVVMARPTSAAAARPKRPAKPATTRRVPPDVTVRAPVRRSAPAPADRTVVTGRTIRLGTPDEAPPQRRASPLAVATVLDGAPLGDADLSDDDIPDITIDLGGVETGADIEHATRSSE